MFEFPPENGRPSGGFFARIEESKMTIHPENPRDWYGLGRWKARAKNQMLLHPLCAHCLEKGRVVPAVISDHKKPHRGDWNEFWLGELQSLCRNCHESGKKTQEFRGYRTDIGIDGFPLDTKNHPFYRHEK